MLTFPSPRSFAITIGGTTYEAKPPQRSKGGSFLALLHALRALGNLHATRPNADEFSSSELAASLRAHDHAVADTVEHDLASIWKDACRDKRGTRLVVEFLEPTSEGLRTLDRSRHRELLDAVAKLETRGGHFFLRPRKCALSHLTASNTNPKPPSATPSSRHASSPPPPLPQLVADLEGSAACVL